MDKPGQSEKEEERTISLLEFKEYYLQKMRALKSVVEESKVNILSCEHEMRDLGQRRQDAEKMEEMNPYMNMKDSVLKVTVEQAKDLDQLGNFLDAPDTGI